MLFVLSVKSFKLKFIIKLKVWHLLGTWCQMHNSIKTCTIFLSEQRFNCWYFTNNVSFRCHKEPISTVINIYPLKIYWKATLLRTCLIDYARFHYWNFRLTIKVVLGVDLIIGQVVGWGSDQRKTRYFFFSPNLAWPNHQATSSAHILIRSGRIKFFQVGRVQFIGLNGMIRYS